MKDSFTSSGERRLACSPWLVWMMSMLLAAAGFGGAGCGGKAVPADEFLRLTNLGKSHLDRGDGVKALESFQQALRLKPTLPDAQLNVANALLLANRPEEAMAQAQKILEADPNSAAAHYIIGCANLRLGKNEDAVKALQQSQRIDPAVTAVNFQLGLAQERSGRLDEAIAQWQTAIEFDPDHPAAHYRLSQVLQRAGRTDEAAEQLKLHQAMLNKRGNASSDVSAFERCKHTMARLPFQPEEPLKDGLRVTFQDATGTAMTNAAAGRSPIGVIDVNHDGRNSLFVTEGDGFRLWINNGGGRFEPAPNALPGAPEAGYHRILVGDLQNDRYEDIVVLGEKASHVFKVATNNVVTEITRFSGLKDLTGIDGALIDFDYTGKLGLITVQPGAGGLKVYRNLGNSYFTQTGVTSGLPATVESVASVVVDDWNGDELLDVAFTRGAAAPLFFARQRGGTFGPTNAPAVAPASAMASADLNNDLRPDLIVAGQSGLEVQFNGASNVSLGPLAGQVRGILPVDYDNDGWLDLVVFGDGLRLWRNLGSAGFKETTAETSLGSAGGKVDSVEAADFDGDCDTDLVLAMAGGGLKFLRNDGGSGNRQLKLRLVGNRSNASALGVHLEMSAGGLRAARTVTRLPIELGVGKHGTVDSVAVRWFDGLLNNDEIKIDQCSVLALEELQIPTGSCPYLYAWDGKRFRFVTDLLGASPLGLRVSDTRFVDADPREYVWIGDDSMVRPRDGVYPLQLTEELREVLYLDEAKLVVVDHPPGTEIHATSKLRPGGPFPPHELVTLHKPRQLRKATDDQGRDVTALVSSNDRSMLSPSKLRGPQLRGLADPHQVTLDFGPLEREAPLVLALSGWLRFGGGMANVAGSHNPELPNPFPRLEAEVAGSSGGTNSLWVAVDVTVGAPAGKTKTILVDLAGRLPPGARRLRLSSAFELHWDRIALLERSADEETRVVLVSPASADLHWRGYSEFEPLSWQFPLTPDYEAVVPTANWTITPSGWCTKYGSVSELVGKEDNALALIAGGDELTLGFVASAVPPKRDGMLREFFLYSVGWDKDADFHCELGWLVEPLPWHGMDSQLYGRETRPPSLDEAWRQKWNTRWVGLRTLTKADRRK